MIRVPTKDLVGMLTDLVHTAADPASASGTASVLLHTVRGYRPGEPGLSDRLVGTSCTGKLLGHCHIECTGQSEPMLWPVGEVQAVIAVLKPLAKQADHAVELGRDDAGQLYVAEDPDLFGERLKLTFSGMDVAEFPVEGVRGLLTEVRVRPAGVDVPDVLPRTDFAAWQVAPFAKIASRRGELIELFRWHQRLPIMVQIGEQYRGVIVPMQWSDESAGPDVSPSGDVYPLTLDALAGVS
jgi:S-DNA-T family DNA segregation ATPase FtsK/SpoIIIE